MNKKKNNDLKTQASPDVQYKEIYMETRSVYMYVCMYVLIAVSPRRFCLYELVSVSGSDNRGWTIEEEQLTMSWMIENSFPKLSHGLFMPHRQPPQT